MRDRCRREGLDPRNSFNLRIESLVIERPARDRYARRIQRFNLRIESLVIERSLSSRRTRSRNSFNLRIESLVIERKLRVPMGKGY